MKSKQKFVLNPNETAMQNLWRAATLATYIMLFTKRYGLPRFNHEEINELIEEMTLYVVINVLRKIRGGSSNIAPYSKKHTFFQNVQSVAWSCRTLLVNRKFEEIKKRIESVDINGVNENGTLVADMVPESALNPIITHERPYNGYIHRHIKPYKELATVYLKNRRALQEYEDYCAQCKETFVTPVSEAVFRKRNGFIDAVPTKQQKKRKKK